MNRSSFLSVAVVALVGALVLTLGVLATAQNRSAAE